MLLPVEGECEHCKSSEKQFSQIETENNRRLLTPAKLNAPLTKTSSRRVIAALQCKQMKVEIEKMKIEIKQSSVYIDRVK